MTINNVKLNYINNLYPLIILVCVNSFDRTIIKILIRLITPKSRVINRFKRMV